MSIGGKSRDRNQSKNPMKTYAAIKAEIAKLGRQAESMRQAEVAGVIARIKEAIAAYGLTPADLGLTGTRRAPNGVKRVAIAKATVGQPKYQDPKSGKTWTGRGKPPLWIVGVKNRDRFLIEGALSAPKAQSPKKGARRGVSRRAASPVVQPAAVQIEAGAGSQ